MSRLSKSVVLITGASSGIGRDCAYCFAEQGANLILVSRRIERLKQIKVELVSKYKVEIVVFAADVQKHKDVEKVFSSLSSPFDKIDVLINNAGLALGLDSVENLSLENVDAMLDTNVKGSVYFMKLVVPIMKKHNKGHIINVSSIAGLQSYANGSIYCATKHALIAISNSIRLELLDTNIKVSTINPGLVETEFSEVRFNNDKEKAKKVYEGIKPLNGRDIAEIAVFIASRPSHVVVSDINIMPVGQGNVYNISRKN